MERGKTRENEKGNGEMVGGCCGEEIEEGYIGEICRLVCG